MTHIKEDPLLVGSYNNLLVFFSLIVAILASYTALDMASRVTTAQGHASRWWLAGGACAMGTGIWSMHFVGMLAFSLPIPLGFDPAITLLSFVIAIISSAFALWIVCQETLPRLRLGLASVLMGVGIAGMHYTGMAAMRMAPEIRYVPSLFILSIVIAIIASGAALWIAFNLRLNLPQVRLRRAGAAVVMGLAIVGMHYTGMAAAKFPLGSICGAANSVLNTGWVALAIIIVTLVVMAVALIISVLDFRLESRTKEFDINLRIAATAFDSQVSLMITDARGVILRVNQAFVDSTGYTVEEAVGQTPRLLKSGRHDADFYSKMWESIHRTGKWQGEIWDKRKDGDIFPKLLTISSVKGDDGIVTHYVGSHIDITERRRTEDALIESQARLDLALRSADMGVWSFDIVANKRHFDDQTCHLLGIDPATFTGAAGEFFRAIHPEDLENLKAALVRSIELYIPYALEYRVVWPDESIHYISSRARLERKEDGQPLRFIGVLWDITNHQQQEERAHQLLAENETILSNAQVGIVYLKHRHVVSCNRRFEEMFQYEPGELIGKSSELFYDSRETFVRIGEVAYKATPENKGYSEDLRLRHKDGSLFWGTLSGKPIDPDHPHEGSIWIYSDISERKLAEEALRESQERLDLALRSGNMGVWHLDLVTNKRHFDSQQCLLLGIKPATFKGSEEEFFRVIHPDDREVVRVKMACTIEQDIPYESEFRTVWPDGSIHYIAARGKLVRDDQNRPLRINGVIFEITEWREAQDKIKSLAFYDPLTELPNRRLFTDRLQQALVSSARNGLVGALLFIDLDNFKTINDTLGHAMGDTLLQEAATRLTSCVREEDTVARIGGDEFVVMLEYLSADLPEAATQTETIGEKILAVLNQPYQIASHECRSTCSIGITLFNDRQQQTDELLKQADIAMYQAKKAGRNALRFFDTQMQEIVTARATLESELRKAIEKQQFQLHYQIQVDEWRKPIGAEALIRWNHPDRGLVLPAQFIPLAEETGLILPIGQGVLETACAQLKAWEQGKQTHGLVLAVNVSPREFRQADFVAQVRACVRRHAIDPKRLKLELTESLLLENIEATVVIMNALNDIGIQFSLDDFGTGYSSLQYLKRLPFDQIKIDQSFVRDLAVDSGDRAIVRTIIAMAKSLNMEVIAEGVETKEQLQMLLNKGCIHYQGYLFGAPVPIEQFDKQFKQGYLSSRR
jgi:diguanylate cyclase (GGDEF)-like protein/PAS domain S-box-containing protein